MSFVPIQNDLNLWLPQFPFPKPTGHKYDRGHALICGGAIMTGATRLAARAAQRMGAGLVTLAAPKSAYSIYAEALESIIVREADTCAAWTELLIDPKKNAVLIGSGLGIGHQQCDYVLAALATGKPCVLDADALTNFSDNPDLLFSKLHENCILTPHEAEFDRLFGKWIKSDRDKVKRTQEAAALAKCVVLLKGHETVIAQPDGQIIINTNAPPSLATAGAGDVLAGMVLGLITQHMAVFMATAAAVWLHGKIAADFGLGLIAEDLVAGIPGVLMGLPGAVQKI